MFLRQGVTGLVASAMGLATLAAGASIQKDFVVRNAPGMTSDETVHAVREVIAGVSRRSNETIVKQDSVILDHSWQDATLFKVGSEKGKDVPGKDHGNVGVSGGLEVTCVNCYIRGTATAKLSIDPTFDADEQMAQLVDSMQDTMDNVTDTTITWIKDSASDVWDKLKDGIDSEDFELEPLDVDFDIETPDFPEVGMNFQFDGIDIYLMMNAVLSASTTYTFPLFTSETPIGFGMGAENFVGVIFAVELYITVAADDVDLNMGMHLSLEDGLALDMELFGEDIAGMTFNGGQFEFLPVTVQGVSGGSLTAGLRISIAAGIELSTDKFNLAFADVSGGISATVYANLAQFNTKLMTGDDAEGEEGEEGDEDENCALRIEQSFEMNVGAKAGASVAIEALTFGPAPETSIPIFYVTIADICASTESGYVPAPTSGSPSSSMPPYSSGSPVSTPTPTLAPRADGADDLATLTTSTSLTFTAQACKSPGLINCPASLQTTTKRILPTVLSTAIPSSEVEGFEWASTQGVFTTAPAPSAFGDAVKGIETKMKGSPSSYVPPPPPPPEPTEKEGGSKDGDVESDEDSEEDGEGEEDGDRKGGMNTNLIIGLSVGLGVPFLAGIAAGVFFCLKRRNAGGKYAALQDSGKVGQEARFPAGDTSYGGVASRGGPEMSSIGSGGKFEPVRGAH